MPGPTFTCVLSLRVALLCCLMSLSGILSFHSSVWFFSCFRLGLVNQTGS